MTLNFCHEYIWLYWQKKKSFNATNQHGKLSLNSSFVYKQSSTTSYVTEKRFIFVTVVTFQQSLIVASCPVFYFLHLERSTSAGYLVCTHSSECHICPAFFPLSVKNSVFQCALSCWYLTCLLSPLVWSVSWWRVSYCISVLYRAASVKRVCSSDVANKASCEFRTGYWLEGSCLESNYIKGCCGNICHTKIAADDKQGPNRQ